MGFSSAKGLVPDRGDRIAIILTILMLAGGLYYFVGGKRHRFAGTWQVSGRSVEWTFGKDGSWLEDAMIDTRGTYTLLDGNRVRIDTKGMLGSSMIFKYRFDGNSLLLDGESGTTFGYHLTKAD